MITFDENRALRYDPLGVRDPKDRVLKRAVLTDAGGAIVPEWGGEQRFAGPYYQVIDPDTGKVKYGSAREEWERTNTRVPGTNDWYKTAPVDAYQSDVEGVLVTVLADGTVETEKPVHVGDWLVRQLMGEEMCLDAAKFPTLYDLATAR